ncbi:MAG: 3-dehydroquinate synthase [Rickettsiales bacterium]|nr:3-dehydroquinate synthase [Rickettsiales bacterium]
MPISKVNVSLENSPYDIFIGENLMENVGGYLEKTLKKKGKIFIIADENTSKLFAKKITKSLKSSGFDFAEIILPAGEKTKNFKHLQYIIDEVFKHQPERSSTLLALGGGVVGDITGFSASVILRGINFVQIPTSLLAMVDSSVGGKTGINLSYGKNLVGSFYQPKIVLADINALKTLPERELQAGFAEIVKYGLIDDKKFFEYLEKQNDFSEIAYMIEKSCQAKARIVAEDEKEAGKRALLNLGHTFGHAYEALLDFSGKLLHGEAVAIGMAQAFRFSEMLEICPKNTADRVENLLKKFGLRTRVSELKKKFKIDEIVSLMYQDKKVSDKKLTFILANDIGKSFIKKDVDEKILRKYLERDIIL